MSTTPAFPWLTGPHQTPVTTVPHHISQLPAPAGVPPPVPQPPIPGEVKFNTGEVSYLLPPAKAPKTSIQETRTGVKKDYKKPEPVTLSEEDLLPPTEVIQHSYDIEIEDNFQNSGLVHIHLWCLNRDSKAVLIRINDYEASCYLQLPTFVDGVPVYWDEYNVKRIVLYLKFVLKESGPTKYGLMGKIPLHYYKGDTTTPMLCLTFPNLKAMRDCQNLLSQPRNIRGLGNVKVEVWETSITVIRKLLTEKRQGFAQWFSIIGREVPQGSELRAATAGTLEYLCSWHSLTPIAEEVSKTWVTKPGMLAIDIETYTPNHRALPDMLCAEHVAYMTSCVYQRHKMPETRKSILIIVGPCNDIPGSEVIRCETEYDMVKAIGDVINRFDPEIITGYNIFSYDYPYLDHRIKVDFYDWPQMTRLIGRNAVMSSKEWKSGAYGFNSINNLKMHGRISIDMLPIIRRDYKLDKYDLNFVSNYFIKKSKHDVKAEEMFIIYENLCAAKTKVCEECDVKYFADVTPEMLAALPEEVQAMYAKALKDTQRVGEYCLQDAALCIDLFEKLNVWIGLIELSSIVGVTITDLFTRGQQVRCLSQIYDLASRLNYVIDKVSIPKMFYNGGFVFDPKPGLYDNIVCLDFASLYPSIMMAYNVCYTTYVPPEYERLIPDEMCNVNEFEQEEPIDGRIGRQGHVNDEGEGVIPGVNDDPDASDDEDDDADDSAKKTITRKYRNRFVKKEVRDGVLPQLVRELVSRRNKVREIMKGLEAERKCILNVEKALKAGMDFKAALEKYQTEDFPRTLASGLSPEKVEKKFNEDRYVVFIRSLAPELEDLKAFKNFWKQRLDDIEIELIVLDKRQNALKVSANSIYGFLGAQNGGILPLIQGAMSVTAWGRKLIGQVNKYIEDKYGGVIVYGDTDSSMADLHITDSKEVNKWGKRLALEISGAPEKTLEDGTVVPAVKGLFPPPLKVEFEKGMLLLSIKKKKYIYYMYGDNGKFKCDDSGEPIINKKGVSIARRDNCKYFREVYIKLVKVIMAKKPVSEGFQVLVDACLSLMKHSVVPRGNLTIIRELGSSYKSASYFLKVFSEELKRIGKPANPGDRLEYIVVKPPAEERGEKVPLGCKMRTIDMWEESQQMFVTGPVPLPKIGEKPIDLSMVYPAEDVDAMYYIEHVFQNALDQLFEVGYLNELKALETLGYQPQFSHCKFAPVAKPVTMIAKMVNDYLRCYVQYPNVEKEKLAVIVPLVEALPAWFEEKRVSISASGNAGVAVTDAPSELVVAIDTAAKRPSRLRVRK